MSHEIGSATDFYDMIDRIDGFLTDQGHAFGLVYAGDGNGELTNWAGGASSVSGDVHHFHAFRRGFRRRRIRERSCRIWDGRRNVLAQ